MTSFPGQGTPVPGPRGQDGDKYAQWDAASVLGSLSETDRREFDAHLEGCWACRDAVAEISDMPGVLAYGKTEAEARAKAYALALRVIANDVEKSEESSDGDYRLTPDDPAFEKKMAKAGKLCPAIAIRCTLFPSDERSEGGDFPSPWTALSKLPQTHQRSFEN